jgi:hypothetical protein
MQVVDGPLVEYYKSCIEDLRSSGFHILMLALVRDADAPTFYEDLLRYWDSINDVTGRHIVFAVAGGSAAERVGVGAIHGSGYYSEHMALAEKHTFRISQLREMAGPRRNVGPLLGNVAEANTAQISALCDYLQVSEQDLPSLHLTHLETGRYVVLPLTGALGTTVYSACKGIVSQLQPSFRMFDRAFFEVRGTSSLRSVHRKIKETLDRKTELDRRSYDLRVRLEVPKELHERDELVSYFRSRLKDRSEFTPEGIGTIVDFCENATRTAADFEAGKRLLKELALIPRLEKKARRMLNVAFALPAIEFEGARKEKTTLEARREALDQEIAGLEEEVARLRKEERQLAQAKRAAISEQQHPARTAILEAFDGLRPVVPGELAQGRWDFFLSYAAPDRKEAVQVFKRLEDLGPTFMDFFCLLPGQDWQSFLPEIQARCRFTVPLLSRNSPGAYFQNSEIQRAINLMRQGRHQIFPIYLEDGVPAPFGLEQVHGLQYSEFRSGSAVRALERSLARLGYISGSADRAAGRPY